MFEELKLSEEVLKALAMKGFSEPTDIQKQCIPLIIGGSDVVGRSKTGSGKTFAFGLPAIDMINTAESGVEVLTVCPTRELALQVTEEMRKISEFKEGCKIVPVYGGADITRQITALKRAKIVVGTPGRLMDHLDRRTLKMDKIKMVVLDEADEMLNMGFRDDIEKILKHAPSIRQTVMFSATMPPAIKAITKEYMKEPVYVEIGELNSTLDEIEQYYIRVNKTGKKSALIEIFNKLQPGSTIIFSNTKRMAEDIDRILNREGINSVCLHGDMRQSERRRVMESVKTHKAAILVATDVAARGIDIDDVEYIINFDVPKDVEYYIHRIGRTARAGKSGKAITLINTAEQLQQMNEIKKVTGAKIIEHAIAKGLSAFEEIGMFIPPEESNRPSSSRRGGRGFTDRGPKTREQSANRPYVKRDVSERTPDNDKPVYRKRSTVMDSEEDVKRPYRDYAAKKDNGVDNTRHDEAKYPKKERTERPEQYGGKRPYRDYAGKEEGIADSNKSENNFLPKERNTKSKQYGEKRPYRDYSAGKEEGTADTRKYEAKYPKKERTERPEQYSEKRPYRDYAAKKDDGIDSARNSETKYPKRDRSDKPVHSTAKRDYPIREKQAIQGNSSYSVKKDIPIPERNTKETEREYAAKKRSIKAETRDGNTYPKRKPFSKVKPASGGESQRRRALKKDEKPE